MINLIKYFNYDEYVASEFIKKNKASNLEIIDRNNNSYIKAFDYIHNKMDFFLIPNDPNNYREGIILTSSESMNLRRSSLLHLIVEEQSLDSYLYLTESISENYRYFKTYFNKIIGSEYIDENLKGGKIIDGIMHQDMENLSFKDNEFDIIVSSDVLEHVPDYKKGLQEVYRCLKIGGVSYMTFPFALNYKKNLTRAYKDKSGKIIHLLTPEYHGDTLRSGSHYKQEGSLCYRLFGWELIDEVKKIGFSDVIVYHIYDPKFGYIAEDILIFKFIK